MKVINVTNEPAAFDKKKEVIAHLNTFTKKFAALNSIEPKLIVSELRNSNGQFIEITSINFEPFDKQTAWYRVYTNLVIPTMDYLIFDSIFPSNETIKQLNAEWDKMLRASGEVYSTPISSRGNSSTPLYNW